MNAQLGGRQAARARLVDEAGHQVARRGDVGCARPLGALRVRGGGLAALRGPVGVVDHGSAGERGRDDRARLLLDRGEMRGMSSELLQYKTSQQTVMFIPVTPKSLKGHSLYMAFLERVVAAVKQADPQAETSIRDR